MTRLAKFHFLSDTTKGQQLDCIALLETCRANYTYMDKVNTQFCSQILFRATHWIRFWASLQKLVELLWRLRQSISLRRMGGGLVIGFAYKLVTLIALCWPQVVTFVIKAGYIVLRYRSWDIQLFFFLKKHMYWKQIGCKVGKFGHNCTIQTFSGHIDVR